MMKFLRTILFKIIVILTSVSLYAQTPLGGIHNAYTPVTEISNVNCASHVRVGSTSEFKVNDLVLIIQMKGAFQSGQYATSSVGSFEFATVASITGNVIDLTFILLNSYDVSGIVQLVRVPMYTTAEVNSPVTGKVWDGATGGVVALDVSTSLTLNANITADGIGFRGGSTWRSGSACSTMTANDGANSQTAAMKGESFVNPIATNISGRQELYSGGGGGVAHNSGGGGGGNGGAGGKGGSQWEGCGRFFDNGGLGGISSPAIIAPSPRARCGGGGGAGQMNDGVGTGGANGGGIIIIRTPTLIGNGRRITANGMKPIADATNDGAGGGGAGGTIFLYAPTILAGVFIEANGGAGGNVRTGALHGPGGGGGAGSFMYSNASPVSGLAFSVAGALSGRNVLQTSATNQSYLATRGDDGQSSWGVSIPQNNGQYPRLTVTGPSDTTVCPGATLSFRAKTTGTFTRIQWTQGDGAVISTRADVSVAASTSQTYVVSITDGSGCTSKDSVKVNVNTGLKMKFESVDTTLAPCSLMAGIDTAIWIFNNSASNATITNVSCPLAGVTISLAKPVPIVMQPGDRVRIGVFVPFAPGTSGTTTATIQATVSPCDTVVSANIVIRRNLQNFEIVPQAVTMTPVIGCTASIRDSTVQVLFGNNSVEVLDIVEQGTVRVLSTKNFLTTAGVSVPIQLRWTPSNGITSGRLGFVLRYGACVDTLWMDVDGVMMSPRIGALSAIDVSTLILCKNTRTDVDVAFTSADTTTWVVSEVAISGPATTDLVPGISFVGNQIARVNVLPTLVGPYDIVLTVRFLPCDTSITVTIRGSAVNVRFEGTPILVYTEPVIGRRQTLQAIYRNTGTADVQIASVSTPSAPYTLLRTTPPLPCTLPPGGLLTADVELRQIFGIHNDSIVVAIDAPCVGVLYTQLQAEAIAVTKVAIPDIVSRIGTLDTVPVLLVGRPQIDSSLLDTFTISVRWKAKELSVVAGQDGRASWLVERDDDEFVIHITGRWDGSDTLALIPVTSLLTFISRTDLLFRRAPGFLWTNQECNIDYDDGTISVDDPCAGRNIRTISFNGLGAITISPLPARETLVVRVDEDRSYPVVLDVVDVTGRHILNITTILRREFTADVSTLAGGMYMLRITIAGEQRSLPLYIE